MKKRRRKDRFVAESALQPALQALVGKGAKLVRSPDVVGTVAWSGTQYQEEIGIAVPIDGTNGMVTRFYAIEHVEDVEVISEQDDEEGTDGSTQQPE